MFGEFEGMYFGKYRKPERGKIKLNVIFSVVSPFSAEEYKETRQPP